MVKRVKKNKSRKVFVISFEDKNDTGEKYINKFTQEVVMEKQGKKMKDQKGKENSFEDKNVTGEEKINKCKQEVVMEKQGKQLKDQKGEDNSLEVKNVTGEKKINNCKQEIDIVKQSKNSKYQRTEDHSFEDKNVTGEKKINNCKQEVVMEKQGKKMKDQKGEDNSLEVKNVTGEKKINKCKQEVAMEKQKVVMEKQGKQLKDQKAEDNSFEDKTGDKKINLCKNDTKSKYQKGVDTSSEYKNATGDTKIKCKQEVIKGKNHGEKSKGEIKDFISYEHEYHTGNKNITEHTGGQIEICNPRSMEKDVAIGGPTPTTTLLESLTIYDPMRMIKGNPVEYPDNCRDLCYLKAYNKHIANGYYVDQTSTHVNPYKRLYKALSVERLHYLRTESCPKGQHPDNPFRNDFPFYKK